MSTNVPFDVNAAADLTDLSIQKIWIKSKADLTEYHKEYYYIEPVTDYIVKDSSITSVQPFLRFLKMEQFQLILLTKDLTNLILRVFSLEC